MKSEYYVDKLDNNIEKILVYTEDLDAVVKFRKPNANYMRNGKFGVHYIVDGGSDEQKQVFKLLNMITANNMTNAWKITRKKKIQGKK